MIRRKNTYRKGITKHLTGKENHMFALNYISHNIDRNNLYSAKYLSRLNSNSTMRKDNILPNLREKLLEVWGKINSLNFNVKEKTENLVKTQFYLKIFVKFCLIIVSL